MAKVKPVLYNVTTTAKITGVHPQTLRHYEKVGLVVPSRTFGGTRRYNSFEIERLQNIRHLTNEGVNLEGVHIILRQQEEINILRRQIDANHDDSIFTTSLDGQISIKQYSKMSLVDRFRLLRKLHKQQSKMSRFMLPKRPLELEY